MRSTVWTLLVVVVLILGLGVLFGAVAKPKAQDDYISISLIGVMIAQIAAATLGVLTISAEYTTGMIRTTLTAYPRRIQVLVAKGLVFAGLIFVVGLVATTSSALIGDAMLTSRFGDSVAQDSDFFRSVVGSSLYLAVIGLFGLGFGALLRHSAGAITALLGVILLPMIIGPMLPSGGDKVMEYSPMFALIKLIDGGGDTGGPGPWPSLLLIAGYAGIALIAGGARLTTRDV
ncbi:ABC transporter permease subunit [Embleya sp. NPDC020630]|uniref:ABC transporter permease subunit n=1 Tax=Embleya sp. NPDC020630 TaxID=3363979 RepID=UPI0037A7C5E4